MNTRNRSIRLEVRLTTQEMGRLQRLSKWKGLSVSGVIRNLVDVEFQRGPHAVGTTATGGQHPLLETSGPPKATPWQTSQRRGPGPGRTYDTRRGLAIITALSSSPGSVSTRDVEIAVYGEDGGVSGKNRNKIRHALARMARQGQISKVSRGIWTTLSGETASRQGGNGAEGNESRILDNPSSILTERSLNS